MNLIPPHTDRHTEAPAKQRNLRVREEPSFLAKRLSPLCVAVALLGPSSPVVAQELQHRNQSSADSLRPKLSPVTAEQQIAQTPQNGSQLILLYVNSSSGNDSSGNGSDRAPFKTITRALNAAGPNTAILLAPGTYSAQTGEKFPLMLKPKVSLQGNPNSRGQNIIIQGSGYFLSPTSAGQNITILAADEAAISGVTITNPSDRGYGLWIESSSPIITNNTFTGNTHDGISVVGTAAPLIRGNYFSQNGANGITLFGTSRAQVEENTFERTGFGINVAQEAAPLLIGNRISFNKDGVVVQASARPVLRNNSIERNQRDGVIAIAQAQPDLGTSAEPGGNVIRNNGRYDIHNAAPSWTIPAYGNQITSRRTQGRIDIAGTYRPAPQPPVASRPLPTPQDRTHQRPIVTPPPATPPSATAPPPTAVQPPRTGSGNGQLPPLPSRRTNTSSRSTIPADAVEIPVPAAQEISQPLPPSTPPNFGSNTPISSEGILPVPGPNIPVGRGGYVPRSMIGSTLPDTTGNPPAPPARGAVLGLRYRVVVDADSGNEVERVQAVAPGAFRNVVNGRSVMQAGAFQERQKAEALLQLLTANGLKARIEEMQ